MNRQILKDEEEKQKIQNDLRILTERSAPSLPADIGSARWSKG